MAVVGMVNNEATAVFDSSQFVLQIQEQIVEVAWVVPQEPVRRTRSTSSTSLLQGSCGSCAGPAHTP